MKKLNIKTSAVALAVTVATFAVSSPTMAEVTPEGPNPKLTMAEEGAFVLAETILSITAAFVTRGGCASVAGGPFSIDVFPNGDGSATYGGVNAISLDVRKGETLMLFGTKYHVSGGGQLDPANEIEAYDGLLTYSHGGAILISNSRFNMLEFHNFIPWDEHNIKDFWLADEWGQWIRDAGLEVITKLEYPLTKWRQTSEHHRWNGGPGTFHANKWLITPFNFSACHIAMWGKVGQLLGGTSISGVVEVSPSDFDNET